MEKTAIKRKDCYVGFYFNSNEDKETVVKLAKKFTAEKKVKHSISDIIRIAVDEFIERNK